MLLVLQSNKTATRTSNIRYTEHSHRAGLDNPSLVWEKRRGAGRESCGSIRQVALVVEGAGLARANGVSIKFKCGQWPLTEQSWRRTVV
jgi:hypothetical protein